MKKNFVVSIHFEGCIQVFVNAKDEDEAEQLANEEVENLSPEVFGQNVGDTEIVDVSSI